VAAWTLTVRRGAKVERERLATREDALDRMATRGAELEREARAKPIDTKLRRFEPAQQVYARVELSGPGRVRAGVDVRGNGSAEGYTGRIRRQLVQQRSGETPYQALGRVLGGL
jgi:hypothetical protein